MESTYQSSLLPCLPFHVTPIRDQKSLVKINWVRHSSSLSGLKLTPSGRGAKPRRSPRYLMYSQTAPFNEYSLSIVGGPRYLYIWRDQTNLITDIHRYCGSCIFAYKKAPPVVGSAIGKRWHQVSSQTNLFLLIAAQTGLPPQLHITNRDPILGKGQSTPSGHHSLNSLVPFNTGREKVDSPLSRLYPREFVLPGLCMKETWTGWWQRKRLGCGRRILLTWIILRTKWPGKPSYSTCSGCYQVASIHRIWTVSRCSKISSGVRLVGMQGTVNRLNTHEVIKFKDTTYAKVSA